MNVTLSAIAGAVSAIYVLESKNRYRAYRPMNDIIPLILAHTFLLAGFFGDNYCAGFAIVTFVNALGIYRHDS
jgi:hypothetical protein